MQVYVISVETCQLQSNNSMEYTTNESPVIARFPPNTYVIFSHKTAVFSSPYVDAVKLSGM